mmetsp:Transcript_3290/g.8568  ORF Transcript_3290/g.8568 Transcript_3290/m.8568 type:complete len:350 (-) Transcript_3290:12-1061(-)
MARQPHHAHVMREVLAAELSADTEVLAELGDLVLPLEVAEGAAALAARRRQVVVIFGARKLNGLEAGLSGSAADDQGDVVRRARAGAKGLQLLLDEGLQLLGVEQGLGLLVQIGLVGRAASLGHEHELVLAAWDGHHVDLRWEVALGVLLGEHGQRRHLGVPQVALRVGIIDAATEVLLVLAVSHDVLAALSHDDAGAGVLAAWQVGLGCDDGVLQEVARGEAVVVGRLRVGKDLAELSQVAWAQEVADLGDAVLRQLAQHPGLDGELLVRLAEHLHLGDRDALAELLVLRIGHVHGVRVLEHGLVCEGHIGRQVLHLLAAIVAGAVAALLSHGAGSRQAALIGAVWVA